MRNQDRLNGVDGPTDAVTVCPACDSHELVSTGSIDTTLLIAGYAKFLGVAVDALFAGIPQIVEMQCRRCGLLFFYPPVAGDDRFYAALGELPWYYMSEKPEFAVAAAHIAEGARVLEVGCGRGAFAARLDSAVYTGLEFSAAAAAKARAAGLDIRQQSIEDHARAHSDQYDVACSFQVLEHTPAPRAFLEGMAVCVRRGGRVIVSVPSEDGYGGAVINDFLNLPPHHLTRWSDHALIGLGERTGLVLERLEPEAVASYHRGRFLATWIACVLPLGLRGRPGWRLISGRLQRLIWGAVAAFSQAAARTLPAAIQSLADRTQSRGHTVVAVFRKD